MKRLIPLLLALVSCSAFAEDGYQRGIKDIDGVPAFFYPGLGGSPNNDTVQTAVNATTVMNSATTANRAAFTGHLYIDGRPTTAKNCTAAGGCSIGWRAGTISGFAGADDSIDIGIQDTDTANGPPTRPDGTYGVKGTFVGNVDPPTSAAWNTSDMETDGDDTSYSHGDLISVTFDLTACNGCSVSVAGFPPGYGSNLPSSTYITGSAWTQAGGQGVNILITFDDGTFGWLDGTMPTLTTGTTAFNTGSANDEQAMCFTVPRKMEADALYVQYVPGANADGNLTLYANATSSSPTQLYQFSLDANIAMANTVARWTIKTFPATSRQFFYPGVIYAVALQATTANSLSLGTSTLAVAAQQRMVGGASAYGCQRDGSSGAFATISSNTILYAIGARISGVGDR